MFNQAKKMVQYPLLIAIFMTLVRFYLECLGIPEHFIFWIGLLWLSLAVSVYWGIKLNNQPKSYATILVALLIFSPISRLPVAIAWWVDTEYQLGTHYGWYFDSFSQVLLNQIIYGSLVQLIPSLILASFVIFIANKT